MWRNLLRSAARASGLYHATVATRNEACHRCTPRARWWEYRRFRGASARSPRHEPLGEIEAVTSEPALGGGQGQPKLHLGRAGARRARRARRAPRRPRGRWPGRARCRPRRRGWSRIAGKAGSGRAWHRARAHDRDADAPALAAHVDADAASALAVHDGVVDEVVDRAREPDRLPADHDVRVDARARRPRPRSCAASDRRPRELRRGRPPPASSTPRASMRASDRISPSSVSMRAVASRMRATKRAPPPARRALPRRAPRRSRGSRRPGS